MRHWEDENEAAELSVFVRREAGFEGVCRRKAEFESAFGVGITLNEKHEDGGVCGCYRETVPGSECESRS